MSYVVHTLVLKMRKEIEIKILQNCQKKCTCVREQKKMIKYPVPLDNFKIKSCVKPCLTFPLAAL